MILRRMARYKRMPQTCLTLKGVTMRQFIHGICVEKKNSPVYRSKLIHAFAKDYDLTSDRLWNCLRVRPLCREFSEVEKLSIPGPVFFYEERCGETYQTTFAEVCDYLNQLEPWEFIDGYIFDESYRWLICITHEDLRCLLVGFEDERTFRNGMD